MAPRAGATVLVPADLGELVARRAWRSRAAASSRSTRDGPTIVAAIETIVTLETEAYLKGQLGETSSSACRAARSAAFATSSSARRSSPSVSASSCFSARRAEGSLHARPEPGCLSRRADAAGDWMVTPPPVMPAPRRPDRARRPVAAARCRSPISNARSARWPETRDDRRRASPIVRAADGRARDRLVARAPGVRVPEVRLRGQRPAGHAEVDDDAGSLLRDRSRACPA